VGNDYTTLQRHFLDVPQAQREPLVQPHRTSDEMGWETIAFVADSIILHPAESTRRLMTAGLREIAPWPAYRWPAASTGCRHRAGRIAASRGGGGASIAGRMKHCGAFGNVFVHEAPCHDLGMEQAIRLHYRDCGQRANLLGRFVPRLYHIPHQPAAHR
jgi:hypothetical protein